MKLLEANPSVALGVLLGAVAVAVLPIQEIEGWTPEDLDRLLSQLDDDVRGDATLALTDMLVGIRDWADDLLGAVTEAAAE